MSCAGHRRRLAEPPGRGDMGAHGRRVRKNRWRPTARTAAAQVHVRHVFNGGAVNTKALACRQTAPPSPLRAFPAPFAISMCRLLGTGGHDSAFHGDWPGQVQGDCTAGNFFPTAMSVFSRVCHASG